MCDHLESAKNSHPEGWLSASCGFLPLSPLTRCTRMCICTSSCRLYYPKDSQLAQRLQINQTMVNRCFVFFATVDDGERLVSIIYDIKMPCRGAHSQGETIRAKLRVQLRPENSSVVPLLLAARGHAIDVHVVAGVAHRPEAIVRTPECAVCLPFLSKNEIIKACSQSHSNGIAERNY